MKKNTQKVVALVLTGMLAVAGLTGCSDDSEAEEQEAQETQTVLEKLDALQTQMDEIQTYLGGEADSDRPQIVMAGLKSAQEFLNQMDEVEERVSAAAIAVDSAAIPENEDERPAAYFEAIAPLEELEAELDLLEDAFITAHGKETIKSKELWQLEARKGEIEDMILLAKDALEFRMSAEK